MNILFLSQQKTCDYGGNVVHVSHFFTEQDTSTPAQAVRLASVDR